MESMLRHVALALMLSTSGVAVARDDDAARMAQAASDALPEDVGLALAAGRAWLAAGRPGEALDAFERAEAIAPSRSARLGAIDALLALGRVREARERRLGLAREDPARADVLRRARSTGRPWSIEAGGAWAGGGEAAPSTWASWVSGRWVHDRGPFLGLGWRYGETSLPDSAQGASLLQVAAPGPGPVQAEPGPGDDPGAGPGSPGGADDPGAPGAQTPSPGGGTDAPGGPRYGAVAQLALRAHQASVSVGHATPHWGVSLDGVLMIDADDGVVGGALVAGGRLSLLGDARISTSWSRFPDGDVGGLTLAWTAPLGPYVTLTPVLSGQLAGTTPLGTASLTAAAGGRSGGGWIGGRYGRAWRPVGREPTAILDLPGVLTWGAWAGARIGPFGPVALHLTGTLDGLDTDAGEVLLGGIVASLRITP